MTTKPIRRGHRGHTYEPCNWCKGARQQNGERPKDNVCHGCQTLLRRAERIIELHAAAREHSHLQTVPRGVNATLGGASFNNPSMSQVVHAASDALTRLARSIGIPLVLADHEQPERTLTGGSPSYSNNQALFFRGPDRRVRRSRRHNRDDDRGRVQPGAR